MSNSELPAVLRLRRFFAALVLFGAAATAVTGGASAQIINESVAESATEGLRGFLSARATTAEVAGRLNRTRSDYWDRYPDGDRLQEAADAYATALRDKDLLHAFRNGLANSGGPGLRSRFDLLSGRIEPIYPIARNAHSAWTNALIRHAKAVQRKSSKAEVLSKDLETAWQRYKAVRNLGEFLFRNPKSPLLSEDPEEYLVGLVLATTDTASPDVAACRVSQIKNRYGAEAVLSTTPMLRRAFYVYGNHTLAQRQPAYDTRPGDYTDQINYGAVEHAIVATIAFPGWFEAEHVPDWPESAWPRSALDAYRAPTAEPIRCEKGAGDYDAGTPRDAYEALNLGLARREHSPLFFRGDDGAALVAGVERDSGAFRVIKIDHHGLTEIVLDSGMFCESDVRGDWTGSQSPEMASKVVARAREIGLSADTAPADLMEIFRSDPVLCPTAALDMLTPQHWDSIRARRGETLQQLAESDEGYRFVRDEYGLRYKALVITVAAREALPLRETVMDAYESWRDRLIPIR